MKKTPVENQWQHRIFNAKRCEKDIHDKSKEEAPPGNYLKSNLLKCFLNPECLLNPEMMVLALTSL